MESNIKLGIYQHFKGQKYKVIGVAKHSETMEEMVVYQKQYDDFGLMVRPAAMFQEEVDRDGYKGPRFRFIQNT